MSYVSLTFCSCPSSKILSYKNIDVNINPNHIISITVKYGYLYNIRYYYYQILLSNNKKLYVNSKLARITGILTAEISDNPECLKFKKTRPI